MQEALFFGPADQQIFANYHPAARGNGRILTVICPPLFADYGHTHLALRELALALAERDQHVLRFDYRGTGDSAGDLGEVAVSDWVEDIGLAVREGRELSGCSNVRLMGVRFSSLLVSRAAGRIADVERFVFWDPVADGTGYLQALRRVQAETLAQMPHLSRTERREAMSEYAGYRLSERMVDEVRALDANTYSGVAPSKFFVVRTSSASAFPVQEVHETFVPFECKWESSSEDPIVARPVLESLIACLQG